MSDFLVKNHLEKDIFPVRKYVDDSWWGFIETVFQVYSQKNSEAEGGGFLDVAMDG